MRQVQAWGYASECGIDGDVLGKQSSMLFLVSVLARFLRHVDEDERS